MQRITLILETATGDDRPFPVRLRRFLKSLLRTHGIRCVGISADAPIKQNGAAVPAKELDRPAVKEDHNVN